jgi:hypothetical protein
MKGVCVRVCVCVCVCVCVREREKERERVDRVRIDHSFRKCFHKGEQSNKVGVGLECHGTDSV